jgi:hypothetical protein
MFSYLSIPQKQWASPPLFFRNGELLGHSPILTFMCIAYSFGFVWLHFSGHVYCIHFGFVFFGSLYMQVIQGFIHDDHEDLINNHVMIWRMFSYLSIPQKQWASPPLFFRNGELLGHSPILTFVKFCCRR